MIKKRFFMPLLAALALTACSDSDTPNGPVSNDFGYVAVNIVQSNENSRAAAAGTFTPGSEAENYAESGLFFIFNSDGKINGTPQTVALTKENDGGDTPAVEKVYSAVLVVDGVKNESKPTAGLEIVCVLNAPATLASGVSNISDLTSKIEDYEDGCTSKGTFLMTNSVYSKKSDGTAQVGAIVTEENIKPSASAAMDKPVEIYVERVVAKVNISTSSDFANNGAKPIIDGEETQLDIVITGLEIANIADKSYLIKNIDGINKDWTWVWDETNKRSYWETVNLAESSSPVFPVEGGGFNTKGDFRNQSYNDIVGTGNFNINNFELNDQYIQPNTSGKQKTAVLVTAELRKHGEKNGLDFVFYKGYFTPDEALKLIATEVANAGYWKLTEDADGTKRYSTLAPADFEWKNQIDLSSDNRIEGLKDYEVVARFKGDATKLYKKTGDTYTPATADELNAVLSTKHARYYTEGKCYYYVEIDQTPAAKDNGFIGDLNTYLGVVRNHIYNLTLNSIAGLGTPVFDPTDVIIPQRPDDEDLWYLAARVQVLKWKVVNQGVDFNGLQ